LPTLACNLDCKSNTVSKSVGQGQIASTMHTLHHSHAATAVPWHHDGIPFFLISVLLQHLARASQSLGARTPGPAAAVFPATSQDGRRPPGSSMHGAHFGAQMPHLGGNQFPAGEMVRGQDLGAFNAASAPTGRAFGSAPGPVPRSALPNALGPADPSVLFNGWQGLGGKPAPPPAAPMGYAAYALSEQREPTLLNAVCLLDLLECLCMSRSCMA